MFLKLVKHELWELGRLLLPLFGGLLVLAGVARGSIWLISSGSSSLVKVLGTMMIGIFILGAVASVVVTMVLIVQRFARSVHGDEGYLTHTLPVGTHAILLSRLLVSFLAVVLSLLIAWLSFRICVYKVDAVAQIGSLFSYLIEEAQIDTDRLLTLGVASTVVGALTTILQIFAAISIGHSFNSGKVGKSFLFYVALAIAAGLLKGTLNSVLESTHLLDSAGKLMDQAVFSAWYGLGLNLVFGGIYYFLTWLMTRRHLNLA